MKNLIFLLCVVIAAALLHSCRITRYEQFKLPEDLLFAEQLLKNAAYEGTNYKYGLAFIPLVTKRNNVGIYAFTKTSAHRSYYLVFMFDGNNISFSNIDQESELKTFLEQNAFSKRKQKLMFKRINKIKQHNEEVHKSQIW